MSRCYIFFVDVVYLWPIFMVVFIYLNLIHFNWCISYIFLLSLDKALHFPNKGVDDFVNISGMPSLLFLTVCLWMNSRDIQGTPFNYATGEGNRKELLIDFKKKFRLFVGNTKR